MDAFNLIENKGSYSIGFEDIVDPLSGEKRREYQVRGSQGQLHAVQESERGIRQRLAEMLANQRNEVPAGVTRKSAGWGIETIQIQDGNGRVLSEYFVLITPNGTWRPDRFNSMMDAESALIQLLIIDNLPDHGSDGPTFS